MGNKYFEAIKGIIEGSSGYLNHELFTKKASSILRSSKLVCVGNTIFLPILPFLVLISAKHSVSVVFPYHLIRYLDLLYNPEILS